MDAFVIHGGRPLAGTLRVDGSKNAALPLMAAALLTDAPVVLRDVPDLSDIRNMARLLRSLGCEVDTNDRDAPSDARGLPASAGGDDAATAPAEPAATPARVTTLRVTDDAPSTATYDIVRTMRAGICVLGPLLARRGHARVSMPGGCAIGDRPVDLHLRGLEKLGARIELDGGYIVASAPAPAPGSDRSAYPRKPRLRGAHVFLGGPNGSTVLGTANVMSAAALAHGVTVIEAAACEPEIEDLAKLLNAMGADIAGAGTPRVTIRGVESLGGAHHVVMPDRIVAGTYVAAAAMTRGDVTLDNFPAAALTAALDRLHAAGVDVEPVRDAKHTPQAAAERSEAGGRLEAGGATHPGSTPYPALAAEPATVAVHAPDRLAPVQLVTQPHPGFPTDLQAQFMALLTLADGNSIVTEKIFPDRFLHVAELLRMGADLTRSGPTVLVSGVDKLVGAPVMASDLRASAGLVIAALAAEGRTLINRVYHLDRGYEQMEVQLQRLGADIERVHRDAV